MPDGKVKPCLRFTGRNVFSVIVLGAWLKELEPVHWPMPPVAHNCISTGSEQTLMRDGSYSPCVGSQYHWSLEGHQDSWNDLRMPWGARESQLRRKNQ